MLKNKKNLSIIAIIISSILLLGCKSTIPKEINQVELEEYYPQKYTIINSIENIGVSFGKFGDEYIIGQSDFFNIEIKNEEQAISHLNNYLELLKTTNNLPINIKTVDVSMIKEIGKSSYRFSLNDSLDVFVLSSYATKKTKKLESCSARRFAMDTFINETIKKKDFDWEMKDSCVVTMDNFTFPYSYSANGYSPSEKKQIHIFCQITDDNVFFYYMTKD